MKMADRCVFSLFILSLTVICQNGAAEDNSLTTRK